LSNFPAILYRKEDFARNFGEIDASMGILKKILIFFIFS